MRPAQLISFIDLTSLNDDDTPETTEQLCQQALTPYGPVAAVCVYPQFVACAKKNLQNSSVRVATVINFPKGEAPLVDSVSGIRQALLDGADEIDLVMPYPDFLSGKHHEVLEFIQACYAGCDSRALLKVILETGAMGDVQDVFEAARLAIHAGADFVKTSTGKIDTGATLESAQSMLRAIKSFSKKTVGFKASGGVRSVEQAQEYVALAERIMGKAWVSPRTFRLGASSLLGAILAR